jgi:hypothetical protein
VLKDQSTIKTMTQNDKTLLKNIISILQKLGQNIDQTLESHIQDCIRGQQNRNIGTVIFELFQSKKIDRPLMMKLLATRLPLTQSDPIASWWQKEKTIFKNKYSLKTMQKKIMVNQCNLETLLNVSQTELQLVQKLKEQLTQFCRDYFYTYKSGNNYFYSVLPEDEALGARFSPQGLPLRDDEGNLLTDMSGAFRYAVIKLVPQANDTFEEIKETEGVTKDTPEATPLTDSKGIPLSVKYWQIINQDEPKNINKIQASAANQLFQLIDNVSAEEIYQYIITPSFQKAIDSNESSFELLKSSLANICKNFITDYEKLKANTSTDIVLEILLGDDSFQSLPAKTKAILFWNDPYLLADIIVNLYNDTDFKYEDIDYSKLIRFLENDGIILNKINEKRYQFKYKPLLPMGYRTPMKNTFEEEQLTKFQLFQYDDKTIAVAEQWLRDQYPHLIINAKQDDNYLDRLSSDASYYFYQIPANSYMLLDPNDRENPNYYRYRALKNDLLRLINSVKNFIRPVIFIGIINIDNVHYLPYFIYKNNSDRIQVICVDPSPQVYSENLQDELHVDTKTKFHLKAQRIFNDILPDCTFYDPFITQMLRERDCGPNSLQTLDDALNKSLTTNPLLIFNEKDDLLLDTQRLSLRGNSIGYNPYTKSFIYPGEIEIQSNKNRLEWQSRLSGIKTVVYLLRENENNPLSIDEKFLSITEDYSYTQQVLAQTLYDERNTNISAIQSILLSDETGISITQKMIAEYKITLQLPHLDHIASFIKTKVDDNLLQQYTSTHRKNLDLLLEDVAGIILKDYVPEAFETSFNKLLLDDQTNETDLFGATIVDAFLQQHQHVYRTLPPLDQMTIREKLTHMANETINGKLKSFYYEIINDLISRNCYYYLTKELSSCPTITIEALVNYLISKLDTDKPSEFFTDKDGKLASDKIEKAIKYLKTNFYSLICTIFETEVHNVFYPMLKETMNFYKDTFKINSMTLQDLLHFCNPTEKNSFLLLRQVEAHLPSSNQSIPNVISLQEKNSPLGICVVEQVVSGLYKEINASFCEKVKQQVNLFKQNTKFAQMLTSYELINIDNMLNDTGELTAKLDFQPIIVSEGSTQTITIDDYNHIPLIHDELQLIAREILINERDQRFYHLAKGILEIIKESLQLRQLKSVKLNDPEKIAPSLIQAALTQDPDLKIIFERNLITYDQTANHYTQCSSRFLQFFASFFIKNIEPLYNKPIAFLNDIDVVAEFLIAHTMPEMAKTKIKPYLENLNEIRNRILSLNMLAVNSASFNIIINDFKKIISNLAHDLFSLKGYNKGDITPGSLATMIRPTLCSLLGINTALVLMPSEAKEIDEMIPAITDRLYNANSSLPIFKHPCLISLPKITQLPDTLRKELTIDVLLQLLAYWLVNRTSYTSIKYHFENQNLPPLIYQLIKVINNCHREEHQPEQYLEYFKIVLPKERWQQLILFSASDCTSQIAAALLRSKDLSKDLIGHDLTTTSISLSGLNSFLKGRKVQTLITTQEAKRATSQESPKQAITSVEFEQKLREEIRNLIKINTNNHVHRQIDMDEVRKQLTNKFRIIEQSNDENDININSFPRQKLARKGLYNLTLFGDTRLDKLFQRLKARHQEDDNIDEYDLIFLEQYLNNRWFNLCAKESVSASQHYLIDNPNYSDSQYIALATVLAQYYRKHNRIVFMYELLMPDYFLPSKQLKTFELPQIQQEDSLDPDDKNTTTIDDIPLANLIITQSGYALDINSVIYNYSKHYNFDNPYIPNKPFSKEEIKDICMHPKANILIDYVKANYCQSGITPSAIALLQQYIIGTVFESGYGGHYNYAEQRSADNAAQTFMLELQKLPNSVRKALLNETIPGERETVHSTLKASSKFCATLRGTDLAKVVIAYNGQDHGLPNFIIDRISIHISQRNYLRTREATLPVQEMESFIMSLNTSNSSYKIK